MIDERAASSTIRAALDVLVFAPLGLGATLVDDGPAAVKRARQELSNARFLGRMVVTQSVAQLRDRIDPTPSVEPEPHVAASPDVSVAEPPAPEATEIIASDLALPDYDHLPAIDIVAKLPTLNAEDRAAIQAYESSKRSRRTVLGKLAQLAESS